MAREKYGRTTNAIGKLNNNNNNNNNILQCNIIL